MGCSLVVESLLSMHEALGSPLSAKDRKEGCRILHQQLAYAITLDKLERCVVPKRNLWPSTIPRTDTTMYTPDRNPGP